MKKIGLWIPTREQMSEVSYEKPGMMLEEVKREVLENLRKDETLEIVEIKDLREEIIESGEVKNEIFEGMQSLIWFGEIGRDKKGEYNLEILKTLENKMKVINPTKGYITAMDKYQTGLFLAKNKIQAPKFMLFSKGEDEEAADRMSNWGNAVLLKPRLGSYGVGIIKVEKSNDLLDIVDYVETETHYLEEFIPNDPKKWIGVNIIGGKHAYSYSKEENCFRDGWKVVDRSKVGGKMILAKPTEKQIKIAQEIARKLDLSWVGVDFITDKRGESFVVDVNTFPGLYPQMFDEAKIDGPKMISDAIFSKINV